MKQNSYQTSIYAFAGWIASVFAYVAFLMWAFLPESFLKEHGITYYPSKYYAIALPAYSLVAYGFINVVYVAVNMINTFGPSDIRTVRDGHSRPCAPIMGGAAQNTAHGPAGGAYDAVPEIGDLHPMEISRLRCGTATR
jgi:hypothetical protein